MLFDVTTTTVYTTEVTEEWVVTGAACYNGAGKVVEGWDWQEPTERNANCADAYENGGQQDEEPFFYIVETGDWVQTIEHDMDVTVDWARVGCLNPGGNQPGDWETHPNCFADLP